MRMVGTMWTAHGLVVESLVCVLSGGGLLGGQVLRLGRIFIGVIFVAELRNTVGRADWQIDALAAPVSIGKRAVEVFGIGWIGVAESIPAFPNPVQVGVMEIEQRVTADRGEIGHIASDCKMRQEMRVGVQLGIKAVAARWRVDVKVLVESVQTQPVPVKYVDPFAAVDPGPARAVIQCGARSPEHGRQNQIGVVSGDRVPVGKRKSLVVQHLANDSFELMEHEPMPGQEIPLLILLRIRRVVGVSLASVPYGLGIGLILLREGRDDLCFLFHGVIP